MRDGRRQRLGLATGTEDPATSNDGYLDRILSDQEAAGQSNILNLAEDANVNVRDQRYLNDAYQYYLGGGTGNFADEVAIDTPATTDLGEITADGGGTGQATSGVDLGNNLGFNAGVTPGPSGFIGLDPDMDIAPTDITDYGTYDPPELGGVDGMSGGQATPGAEFADQNPYGGDGTMNDLGADNFSIDQGEVTADNYDTTFDQGEITADNYGTPETDLGEITADDYGTNTFAGNTATLEDAGGTYDGNQSAEGGFGLESEFAPYGVNPNTGEAYQTPRSISDQNAVLGQTFAAEDVDTQGNLLQSGIDKMKSVFPDFNPIVAAGKIAFNSYIGAPVTLAFDALKAIGGMLPEQSAANKFNQSFTKGGANYKDYGYGVLQAGNIAQDPFGRNPVSAFGNYEETLAEDLNYEGTNKFNLDKKEFAEKYFKELNNNALLSGDINSANTDIDIDTGNVTGDASVAEDAQDLNLTEVRDDMAGINTGDAGIAEQIEADNRAAEAQAAAAREAEIDANREAAKDAQNEQNAQNARDAAAAANAAARQQALADLYRGGGGDGGGGGGSGDGNSPGGGGSYCFDPSTPIQMADGSIKEIKNIQLGDDTKGGEVTGVFQFKASDDIHNYKGVTVAGGHYVKENNEFIMVKDSPLAIKIDKIPVVYSLDTANRRIFIKNIEFADYNGDGVAKNFLSNAGVTLEGFDKEVLRQVQQRLI